MHRGILEPLFGLPPRTKSVALDYNGGYVHSLAFMEYISGRTIGAHSPVPEHMFKPALDWSDLSLDQQLHTWIRSIFYWLPRRWAIIGHFLINNTMKCRVSWKTRGMHIHIRLSVDENRQNWMVVKRAGGPGTWCFIPCPLSLFCGTKARWPTDKICGVNIETKFKSIFWLFKKFEI